MHSTDNLEDDYIGSGKILKYSIVKHGRENHRKEILEYCSSRGELKQREKEIVNEELLTDPLNINLKYGGEGGSNGLSLDTRNKISVANKGKGHRIWTNESRQKLSRYRTGKGHATEAKTKISRANMGRIPSVETREKMSTALKKILEDPVKREQRRNNIKGRSFYNDGNVTILVFPNDARLTNLKWVRGKKCQSLV